MHIIINKLHICDVVIVSAAFNTESINQIEHQDT